MTVTLTEFLLARIAEDEERAAEWTYTKNVGAGRVRTVTVPVGFMSARVLADCEAKRRIVEAWTRLEAGDTTQWVITGVWDEGLGYAVSALEFALGCLAAVYADHPDFDPEWAV